MKWRNLYLAPSKALISIVNKFKPHLKYVIDDFGYILVKCSEETMWEIIEAYYKKKGVKFKDHGNERIGRVTI